MSDSNSPSRGRRIDSMTREDVRHGLLGVFFTFAPIGILVQLVMDRPGNALAGLVGVLIGGGGATLWAYAFITRRYWIIPAPILLQAVLPTFIYTAMGRWGLLAAIPESASARRVILGAMAVLFCVIGYVLMIRFTRAYERRATILRTELGVAATMHRVIVPDIEARLPGALVFGRSVPSSTMGGDLIDIVARDHEADLIVADVSGHGVGAGIVMGMLKAGARMRLREAPTLRDACADLNAVLHDLVQPGMFATMACARLKPGRVEITLAGHLPVLQFVAATGKVRLHPNDSLPLGIVPEEEFVSVEAPASPGDVLAIFTDGLVEVMDAQSRMLGLEAIVDCFAKNAARPLPEIHERLMALVASHGPRTDDQSLLLARIVEPADASTPTPDRRP